MLKKSKLLYKRGGQQRDFLLLSCCRLSLLLLHVCSLKKFDIGICVFSINLTNLKGFCVVVVICFTILSILKVVRFKQYVLLYLLIGINLYSVFFDLKNKCLPNAKYCNKHIALLKVIFCYKECWLGITFLTISAFFVYSHTSSFLVCLIAVVTASLVCL